MIANILKLSKTGWHVFLNGTGEQQLIAGMAIGAIVGVEKAVFAIRKSKLKTKELKKKLNEQLKKSDELITRAERDCSKAKEAKENFEQVKKELEEAKKNDPMKEEMENLIRLADYLYSED